MATNERDAPNARRGRARPLFFYVAGELVATARCRDLKSVRRMVGRVSQSLGVTRDEVVVWNTLKEDEHSE